eukprot:TRINITY_DN14119_c0_g1_i1.p3 TRINITY_DN14119_c0_g1~~TRINITY_DN14119_c0_g1_i1.p3  ORF type:complete len:122 (+),score=14.14 TRINITY_DN14119_c0_g1_i1:170-535(+)
MDATSSHSPPHSEVPTPAPTFACRAQAAAEASLRSALAEPPTRPAAPPSGPGVVLIACGSFSPLTTAHLAMLGTAVGRGAFSHLAGAASRRAERECVLVGWRVPRPCVRVPSDAAPSPPLV